MILDGFGISFFEQGNAIAAAKMENYQRYLRAYPCAVLRAAGIEVGLPWGEVGNSEVGHKSIGSGRVIYQPLPKITLAIHDKSFFKNPAFQQAAEQVKERPGAQLHLMGCVSQGGIHSHLDHLLALCDFAGKAGIGERTVVHAFLDGRDAPPQSAHLYLRVLESKLTEIRGTLGSLIGRYYAMDRNNNWDRTQAAYRLLVEGKGAAFQTWHEALKAGYVQKPTDEYLPASVIGSPDKHRIADGDAVVFFNFRPDRERQLTQAFVSKTFGKFAVKKFTDLAFITMTEYEKGLPVTVAFPEEWAERPVGRVVSEAGLRQLRIAETEKYAHVTYYFNSGREVPFPKEDRVLIPSPNVRDYADSPHMSAGAITDRVVQEIRKGKYDFIVMNYANPDMIGHTGDFKATVEGLRFLDTQLKRVVDAALGAGGAVLLTCDHGNAEEKKNPKTGEQTTDHTTNPVPLIYLEPQSIQDPPKDDEALFQILSAPIGVLADVGPTVLDILGLTTPPDMVARSLLDSLL